MVAKIITEQIIIVIEMEFGYEKNVYNASQNNCGHLEDADFS